MSLRSKILLLLLVFIANEVKGVQYTYEYNTNCSKAYKLYMSLKIDEGNKVIRSQLLNDPYNLMATYVADYDDVLTLLFNGDIDDYNSRKGHLNQRLDLLDKGDEKSPWHKLCKAGLYMHWALVNVRFGENLKAANYFRKSYALMKDNRKAFPDFEYNDMYLGMEEAALGAVPDDFKWIASIFGMSGNVKKGVNRLSNFLNKHNSDDPLYLEAQIYYSYLRFYLQSDQVGTWSYLNSRSFSTTNNLLFSFVRSNIALNYRKADHAFSELSRFSGTRDFQKYPILQYELGAALMHKLDKRASEYFLDFLQKYKGRLFVKDTWQKLAFINYIYNDMKKAEYARGQILTHGSTIVDADKQALRFAKEDSWPNKTLLQVRLLIDGGFYNDALSKIERYDERDFPATADRLEYLFRYARIFDEMSNDAKAIQYYQKVIDQGQERKEHFAARSALQIGFIYEAEGKDVNAVRMYRIALAMKNHDYKNSIDQQAKAGINRLTIK